MTTQPNHREAIETHYPVRDERDAAWARIEREYADYRAYCAETSRSREYAYPHCDSLVLHHPFDECIYCNRYAASLQLFRHEHHIAFTGHEPADGERPCPATLLRPVEVINRWHGNIPFTAARQLEFDQYWADVRAMLAKMDETH